MIDPTKVQQRVEGRKLANQFIELGNEFIVEWDDIRNAPEEVKIGMLLEMNKILGVSLEPVQIGLKVTMSKRLIPSLGVHRIVRRLFAVVWSAWIDDGWSVEQVKSWRSARLIYKTGRKQTITIMPIASWKNGWRPWH